MYQNHRIARPLGLAAAATMTLAIAGVAPAHSAPAQRTASVSDGVLTIAGTAGADTIAADFTNADAVSVDLGDRRASFDRRTFHSISVFLGSGDDSFRTLSGGSAATDLPLALSGGRGDDSITGGAGNDTIVGGDGDDRLLGGAGTDVLSGDRGDDFVNGQVGTDTERLGSGDDVAGWLPGEGSDAVFGGSGHDTLAFAGAGGDEVMSLTAAGSHAVFLRSPGAVRMDLDDVERLDLDALGGADTVTIDDLSGTDLDEALIDLSSGGVGDGKVDIVTVEGTDKADAITVGASDAAVDIDGLHTRTVIGGSDPTDQLHLDARGGNDRVDVSAAARALLEVFVDLGAGQ